MTDTNSSSGMIDFSETIRYNIVVRGKCMKIRKIRPRGKENRNVCINHT